jgi:hypothetical protein
MERIHPFQESALRGACIALGMSAERLILVVIDREIPLNFLTVKQASKIIDWLRLNLFKGK